MSVAKVSAAVEIAATALWTGSSAGFAFISAPVAFRLVDDRDVFAEITRRSLERLSNVATVAGGVAVAAAAMRRAPVRAALGTAALALLAYHQRSVVPEMARAQSAMGSLQAVPEDDPRRVAYRSMHRRSARVFGAALLLGVSQLVLASIERP